MLKSISYKCSLEICSSIKKWKGKFYFEMSIIDSIENTEWLIKIFKTSFKLILLCKMPLKLLTLLVINVQLKNGEAQHLKNLLNYCQSRNKDF